MRDDFDKLVTEKGRHKGWKDSTKSRRSRIKQEFLKDPEAAPKRMSNREMYGWKEDTHITWNLFKKFLQSRVGQNWDKVYSEVHQVMRHGNPAFNQHADWQLKHVETNTFMKDGEVWYHDLRAGDLKVNAVKRGWWYMGVDFYVHPESRILCRVDHQVARKAREQEKKAREKTALRVFRKIDDYTYLARIRDIWWEFKFQKDEKKQPYWWMYKEPCIYKAELETHHSQNIHYRKPIPEYEWLPKEVYGYHAISRRQLNKKEKKAYGIDGL